MKSLLTIGSNLSVILPVSCAFIADPGRRELAVAAASLLVAMLNFLDGLYRREP